MKRALIRTLVVPVALLVGCSEPDAPPRPATGDRAAAPGGGVARGTAGRVPFFEGLGSQVLCQSGKADEGIAVLREAVRREDALRYDEPPNWILPVRHVLGAALLRAGRAAEAEAVYREDLARLPENGWSLFGLARSLRLEGRDGEADPVEARFRAVWARADVKLSSSCFCLPGGP